MINRVQKVVILLAALVIVGMVIFPPPLPSVINYDHYGKRAYYEDPRYPRPGALYVDASEPEAIDFARLGFNCLAVAVMATALVLVAQPKGIVRPKS